MRSKRHMNKLMTLSVVSPHLISKIEKTDGNFSQKLYMGVGSSLCHSKPYKILQMPAIAFFDKRNI